VGHHVDTVGSHGEQVSLSSQISCEQVVELFFNQFTCKREVHAVRYFQRVTSDELFTKQATRKKIIYKKYIHTVM
jgi:hypothetical protein